MLNRRIIYFTLLLTVLGLVGIYWQLTSMNHGQSAVNKAQSTIVSLLAANQDLSAGQALAANQLQWLDVSAAEADKLVGVLSKQEFSLASISQAVLAYPVAKGELLRTDALVMPTDNNYLSVALAPGKRGLAIKVDAQSAMAGLVKPGDQVDVLFYHKLGRSKKDFTNQISASARNLVTNVKLLAVNRTIDRVTKSDADDEFNKNSTVTLEVDSRQASQLLIAQQIGQLSLALVSKHKAPNLATTDVIDFDQLLPEFRQDTDIVNLLKGNKEEVIIKNNSLMMSTKVDKTGGEDNVF